MRQAPRRQAGFTLIELLVTIALLGILLRLVVPSFGQAMLTNRLASYTNSFVASAQFARSEAVKRNAQITLCRSSDGTTCATSGDWTQGWIVRCSATTAAPTVCNSSGTESLVLQKQDALSTSYHFTTTSTGNPYSLTFPASGVGATQATLKLCRFDPSPGSQERQITLTATGRTAVSTTRTGTCS